MKTIPKIRTLETASLFKRRRKKIAPRTAVVAGGGGAAGPATASWNRNFRPRINCGMSSDSGVARPDAEKR